MTICSECGWKGGAHSATCSLLPKERCPQDPQHLLEAHGPGGTWYGRGHNGRPSPWLGAVPEVTSEHDPVNHPSHYTAYKGLEVIELTEQMNFNRGNAVKYICRAGLKAPEKTVEDLEKAAWYIAREIERIKNE